MVLATVIGTPDPGRGGGTIGRSGLRSSHHHHHHQHPHSHSHVATHTVDHGAFENHNGREKKINDNV